jgi:hypothetical protein
VSIPSAYDSVFFLPKVPRSTPGPTQPSVHWALETLSPGGKAAGA